MTSPHSVARRTSYRAVGELYHREDPSQLPKESTLPGMAVLPRGSNPRRGEATRIHHPFGESGSQPTSVIKGRRTAVIFQKAMEAMDMIIWIGKLWKYTWVMFHGYVELPQANSREGETDGSFHGYNDCIIFFPLKTTLND